MDTENRFADEPARIISKLDRNQGAYPDTDQPPPVREPSRKLIPEARPVGKLLYNDEVILRQMCDCIVASTMYDKTPSPQIPKDFFASPFKYIAEHFISTPSSARWSQVLQAESQEHSNEFELDWDRGKDINFNHLALVLASVVPAKKSVKQLIDRISKQRDDDLVYPGMPIRVHGTVLSENDILPEEIHLHGEVKSSVQVIFDCKHGLGWSAGLFQGRFTFALGIIQSIGKDTVIKAGALLL